MHKGLIAASVAAILLASCSTGHAENADAGGPAGSRSFAVGAFSRVEVGGPYTVNVTTGGQPGVTARGPQGALDKMVVEVRDGTLQIGSERGRNNWNWFGNRSSNSKGVTVEVSGPMIDGAGIGGSGNITVNRIAGASFKGEVGGSGALRLPSVEVQSLELGIAGSGSVQAKGRANSAKYEIAGSGDIRAADVQSATAEASIAGSGNIAAHVRDTVKAEIAGSGNINISGGAKCSVDRAGSGEVRCS